MPSPSAPAPAEAAPATPTRNAAPRLARCTLGAGYPALASPEAAEKGASMKRFWAVALGVFAPAAFLAANSGAVTDAPSGDTCSVTGSGTSYTLVINLPENAAEQGSFAFGAPGAKVMNINAP